MKHQYVENKTFNVSYETLICIRRGGYYPPEKRTQFDPTDKNQDIIECFM